MSSYNFNNYQIYFISNHMQCKCLVPSGPAQGLFYFFFTKKKKILNRSLLIQTSFLESFFFNLVMSTFLYSIYYPNSPAPTGSFHHLWILCSLCIFHQLIFPHSQSIILKWSFVFFFQDFLKVFLNFYVFL